MNIVKNLGNYSFYNKLEIIEKLEAKNYELTWDAYGNCYLTDAEKFELPARMYDLEQEFRAQILYSYSKMPKNLGVLLDGYKGMGKSVTSKLLCIESGIPVILITRAIPASINFVKFLNEIEQDFVLFIDEFEKIFKERVDKDSDGNIHNQNVFLTFMDGTLSSGSKKLFLLTSNSSIGDKFINRPSRIRYYRKYDYMPDEMYDMVIADKLFDKQFEKDLRENLVTNDCTIDLLTTIIEEINLHEKPYSSFKSFFNHKPKMISYKREILKDDKWEYFDMFDSEREFSRMSTKETLYHAFPGHNADIKYMDANGIIYNHTVNKYDDDDVIVSETKNTYRVQKAMHIKTDLTF